MDFPSRAYTQYWLWSHSQSSRANGLTVAVDEPPDGTFAALPDRWCCPCACQLP